MKTMETVLETTALCKSYRRFKALDGVTMRVPKGAIYGLVGRNGAGKTTLIRLVCGLQDPTSGGYALYGRRWGERGIARVRRRMGAVVETPSLYGELTALDNLKIQSRVLGLPDDGQLPALLELVGLGDTGRKKAKHFSLGMRQRLGIAVALCGDPDFLVLDEPTNGLDPQGIVEMRELILRLNRERGITLLMSSHILDELSRLATCYGFLDQGRMVREVTAEELEASCRKCLRVRVTDNAALMRVLDARGIEYAETRDGPVDVFGEVELTDLSMALLAENCRLLSASERDESLESYYINLVGGGSRA